MWIANNLPRKETERCSEGDEEGYAWSFFARSHQEWWDLRPKWRHRLSSKNRQAQVAVGGAGHTSSVAVSGVYGPEDPLSVGTQQSGETLDAYGVRPIWSVNLEGSVQQWTYSSWYDDVDVNSVALFSSLSWMSAGMQTLLNKGLLRTPQWTTIHNL